jgi:hypothetical protein
MNKQPEAVTIRLPKGALAGWPVLIDAFRRAKKATGFEMTFNDLIAQIEEQTTPPRPDEPTGLGAVVEDADGYHWTCAVHENRRRWWNPLHGGWVDYEHVGAVRVLSEGVQS